MTRFAVGREDARLRAARREQTVADSRLDRLFESLDATFDAAVARQEDEAAWDLAASLRQDTELCAYVSGGGAWNVRVDADTWFPLVQIGTDFIAAEGANASVRVVPAARVAGLVRSDGDPPATSETSLLEMLRGQARRRRGVGVVTALGLVEGSLVAAAKDHLEILSGAGVVLVGMETVREIRLDFGD